MRGLVRTCSIIVTLGLMNRLSCEIKNKSENDKIKDTLAMLNNIVVVLSSKINELSAAILNKVVCELNNFREKVSNDVVGVSARGSDALRTRVKTLLGVR